MSLPVCIYGYGNLGSHLFSYLEGIEGAQLSVISKNATLIDDNRHTTLEKLSDGTLVFLCVPDSVVIDLIEEIPDTCIPIICSGAVHIPDDKKKSIGVWYPLYSFKKGQKVDWEKVPVFCEANHKEVEDTLQSLNGILGKTAFWVDSVSRSKFHLGAVFANNFTNALLMATEEVLSDYTKDDVLNALYPIIKQTITRWEKGRAKQYQTGPAVRRDKKTIDFHLEMMNNYTDEKNLYILMTEYINKKMNK